MLLLEWPPYRSAGQVLAICQGSGPLNLDRPSAYRDCEPPKGFEHLRLKSMRDPTTFNPRFRGPSARMPPRLTQ